MKIKILLAVALIVFSALACYAKTYSDIDGGGFFLRIYEKNLFKDTLRKNSSQEFLVTNIIRDHRNDNIIAYNIFNNKIAVFQNGIVKYLFSMTDRVAAEIYFGSKFVNLLSKIISSEKNYVIKIDKIDLEGRFFLKKSRDGSVEIVETNNMLTVKSLIDIDYNDSVVQVVDEKMLVVGRFKNDISNTIKYYLFDVHDGDVVEIDSGQYVRVDKKKKLLGIVDTDVVNGNILFFDSNDFPSFTNDKYIVFNLFDKKVHHIDNRGMAFFLNVPH